MSTGVQSIEIILGDQNHALFQGHELFSRQFDVATVIGLGFVAELFTVGEMEIDGLVRLEIVQNRFDRDSLACQLTLDGGSGPFSTSAMVDRR